MLTTHFKRLFLPLLLIFQISSSASRLQRGRYGTKPRGCIFGSRTHSIGSTWHPDLGPPFGIMRCVTCRCIRVLPASLNSRGKVQTVCEDVRKSCPPMMCPGAKVSRGGCCKECPPPSLHHPNKSEEDYSAKSVRLFDKPFNDEEEVKANTGRATKHYVSLMTSNNGGSFLRATFKLIRDDLHFTLNYKSNRRPLLIELFNRNQSTLYSHVAEQSPKPRLRIICGVWRNLAKHHVMQLSKKFMSIRATFTQHQNSTSSKNSTSYGRIVRHRALSRETFSALLTKTTQEGSSGAVVMITLGRQRFNRLHFALLFRNDYEQSAKEVAVMTVHFTDSKGEVLKTSEKKILRQVDKLSSTKVDELAEVWQISSDVHGMLGRGSLRMELVVKVGNVLALYQGNVTTKKSCASYQAVLHGGGCKQPASTGAAGAALITIDSENNVAYEILLAGLSSDITSISMLGNYKKKRTRLIADFTTKYKNGKAKGRLENLNGKELHMLLSNRIRISVATEHSNSGEVCGHVTAFPFEGLTARHSELPVLLYGALVLPPVFTGSAGLAWMSMDKYCHLHYEIVVSGLNKQEDTSIDAYLYGKADKSGTEVNHKLLLKGFYSTKVRGTVLNMHSEIYDHLNWGTAFVQVSSKLHPSGEIIGQVHLPNTCSNWTGSEEDYVNSTTSFTQDNSGPETISHFIEPNSLIHDGFVPPLLMNQNLELDPTSCFTEGRWVAEDSKWSPSYDSKCTICKCVRGAVLCDPVTCPPLACDRPVAVDFECCPVCNDGFRGLLAKESGHVGTDSLFSSPVGLFASKELGRSRAKTNNEGCYHESEGRYHRYGSWWHPVIPQFGIISCANCTCKSDGEIACGKVVCPTLSCGNHVRINSNDCCKSCLLPEATNKSYLLNSRDHEMQEDSMGRMCEFGGELRSPGERWKLIVPHVGSLNCFECSCPLQGVRSKCVRKCPSIEDDCGKVERTTRSCCPWRCLSRQ